MVDVERNFAYLDWAASLLQRGDLDGALEKARAAVERSPRFADAIELWAEALSAKHDFAGAASRFKQASALTPRWGHLHLMWGQALAQLGKKPEALEQFRTAAGLDLSAADQALLSASLEMK